MLKQAFASRIHNSRDKETVSILSVTGTTPTTIHASLEATWEVVSLDNENRVQAGLTLADVTNFYFDFIRSTNAYPAITEGNIVQAGGREYEVLSVKELPNFRRLVVVSTIIATGAVGTP